MTKTTTTAAVMICPLRTSATKRLRQREKVRIATKESTCAPDLKTVLHLGSAATIVDISHVASPRKLPAALVQSFCADSRATAAAF